MSPDQTEKPKVILLGSEVGRPAAPAAEKKWDWDWERDHKDNGIVGGAILLVAGGILLLNTLGIIPWSFWHTVWQFWPVLLILIGLEIILGRNFLSRLVMLIVALVALGFIAAFGLREIGSPYVSKIPPDLMRAVEWVEQFRAQP